MPAGDSIADLLDDDSVAQPQESEEEDAAATLQKQQDHTIEILDLKNELKTA